MPKSELVCIKRSLTRIDAELAHGLLETFGIWSLVKADDGAGTRPHMLYMIPARVYVRFEDVEKAREVLSEQANDETSD